MKGGDDWGKRTKKRCIKIAVRVTSGGLAKGSMRGEEWMASDLRQSFRGGKKGRQL